MSAPGPAWSAEENGLLRYLVLMIGLFMGSSFADNKTIDVKCRGVVDLKPFACQG